MIAAKIVGGTAWCGRPGCREPDKLANVGRDEAGVGWVRFWSTRWRRDESTDAMERYVKVSRSGRIIDEGRRVRNRVLRAITPVVAVCPCGAEQTIDLPPPTPML